MRLVAAAYAYTFFGNDYMNIDIPTSQLDMMFFFYRTYKQHERVALLALVNDDGPYFYVEQVNTPSDHA